MIFSCSYVLPTHMMQKLAETLPRELQGIPLCCNPTPPLVKANLLTLHQIILGARRVALEQVGFDELRKSNENCSWKCIKISSLQFLAGYTEWRPCVGSWRTERYVECRRKSPRTVRNAHFEAAVAIGARCRSQWRDKTETLGAA